MVLEELAKAMLSFVDWGRGIIVFLIIIEIFKGLKGSDTVSEAAGKTGKWLWARTPGTKAKAKRVIKKGMNEYVLEAKEEERINEIKRGTLKVAADLEVLTKAEFSSRQVENTLRDIKNLGNRIKGAEKNFRGLNRRTSREQTAIGRLFNYMKKKGLKNAELVEKVTVFEKEILELHQKAADELGKVRADYEGILKSNPLQILRDEVEKNAPSPEHAKAAGDLAGDFKKLAALLGPAYQHETEAKQRMISIISLTRSLM